MQSCPIYKKCGACQTGNMTYEKQLSHKQVAVIRLLGKFCHVDEIVGMEDPYHYRNKVQAAFACRGKKIVSGVYQSSTHTVRETDECLLDDPEADKIIVTVRRLAESFKLKIYDRNTRRGLLRHVLVKRGYRSGETMVVLVTTDEIFPKQDSFVRALLSRHPEITTVIRNVCTSSVDLILGKQSSVLHGEGYITEELMGLRFRISPEAFYQINPMGTEVLYGYAKKFAALTGSETVLDAYCGTGTIGLIMSDCAKHVIGVEKNSAAVKDAVANAELNGIKNARFICRDAGEFMSELAVSGERIDVVITDPPRAGCSREFLTSLVRLAPERVVYVSCNPETLARDLEFLSRNNYKVKKICPVDMFPHTNHVECAVLLSRKHATHSMKLNPVPFHMIKSGIKTIELRLFDEKRQKIKVGDTLTFTENSSRECISVKVKKLHRFDSFEELYKVLPLLKSGYTETNVKAAHPSDMRQYYSAEEERKYGVVGIEIVPLK